MAFSASGNDIDALKLRFDACKPLYAQEVVSLIRSAKGSKNYINYSKSVNNFDWNEFYKYYKGEEFFNWFISETNDIYDIVLIDSRTGISDMGGVCTYHLADNIVLFVAPNQQNIDGTISLAKSLTKEDLVQGRKGRNLSLLFIPSRLDMGEARLLDSFALKFKKEFSKYYSNKLTFKDDPFRI